MNFVSVTSAMKASDFANSGNLELKITVNDGTSDITNFGYSYHPGSSVGLTPDIATWFADNPNFQISEFTPPTVTNDAVNAERDRRIEVGKTFNIVGGLSIPATGTQFDLSIFEAKKSEADGKKAAGDTSASIVFRGADNIIHTLTPDQMLDLYNQGVGFIQAVMEVSWAMKDNTGDFVGGIPTDPPYTNDQYWP